LPIRVSREVKHRFAAHNRLTLMNFVSAAWPKPLRVR
jgi:hypothetical protein